MRKQVEEILGCAIPKHLDFILQSLIIRGSTAQEIAETIKKNM